MPTRELLLILEGCLHAAQSLAEECRGSRQIALPEVFGVPNPPVRDGPERRPWSWYKGEANGPGKYIPFGARPGVPVELRGIEVLADYHVHIERWQWSLPRGGAFVELVQELREFVRLEKTRQWNQINERMAHWSKLPAEFREIRHWEDLPCVARLSVLSVQPAPRMRAVCILSRIGSY